MTKETIIIRALSTMKELEQMQKVESLVWNMAPIPLHHTFTSLKNGGIILGAFDNNEMIGFLYSFPGYKNKEVYLCSHMLGILPDYRMYGLGERMKLKQAKLAKELDYHMITWTFDPLESRNAYLNIHKLEAIGAKFNANYYGSMEDELNQGLPSDRIQIEWHLNTSKKRRKYEFEAEKLLLDIDNEERPIKTKNKQADVALVAIPKNFQTIKSNNFELAKDWRQKTSDIFEELFKAGFIATDLIIGKNKQVNYYVFTK